MPTTDATRQSRAGSLLEAAANVVAGYLLAILAQQLVLPLFGVEIGFGAHAGIAGVFTIVSMLRSYLLRRLFDHLAWQRQEDLRLKRQRLERRFAREPG
jgi:hypothetical protein